jgi:hypothetical protein
MGQVYANPHQQKAYPPYTLKPNPTYCLAARGAKPRRPNAEPFSGLIFFLFYEIL